MPCGKTAFFWGKLGQNPVENYAFLGENIN